MWWLFWLGAALAHPGADAFHAHGCGDPAALVRHTEALTEEGRLDEAREALEEARRCGVEPAQTELVDGVLRLAEGRVADALPPLDRAVDLRDDAPAHLARARAHDILGDHAAAAADRLAALERVPGAAPELYLLAARSLERAGRPGEALALVDQGIEARGPVAGLVREGVLLAAAVDTDEALSRLEPLPPTVGWLTLRAEVLAGAGRTDEAADAYAEALRLARSGRPSPRRAQQIEELTRALAALREVP